MSFASMFLGGMWIGLYLMGDEKRAEANVGLVLFCILIAILIPERDTMLALF